jgi:hypothetical protein
VVDSHPGRFAPGKEPQHPLNIRVGKPQIIIIIIIIIMEGKLDNEHSYEYVPKLVETRHDGKVTILRNQQVQTDRTILTINRTS